MITIWLFLIAHWYLSLFTQSFFYHRYAAHRQFSMSRGWEKFFFIISYIFQGSSYLSPYAYAIMHRLHHANADTSRDPHSPKYDKNIFSMMWETKHFYSDIISGHYKAEEKYTKNLPEWDLFEWLASSWISRIVWGLFYVGFYIKFAPDWTTCWWLYSIMLSIHIFMGPVHGAVINWFAHKNGYRNYETDDTSRNLWKKDFLMWGEGLHNNHHYFPHHANFASSKNEFDPMWPVIKSLALIRVIRLKRNGIVIPLYPDS